MSRVVVGAGFGVVAVDVLAFLDGGMGVHMAMIVPLVHHFLAVLLILVFL